MIFRDVFVHLTLMKHLWRRTGNLSLFFPIHSSAHLPSAYSPIHPPTLPPSRPPSLTHSRSFIWAWDIQVLARKFCDEQGTWRVRVTKGKGEWNQEWRGGKREKCQPAKKIPGILPGFFKKGILYERRKPSWVSCHMSFRGERAKSSRKFNKLFFFRVILSALFLWQGWRPAVSGRFWYCSAEGRDWIREGGKACAGGPHRLEVEVPAFRRGKTGPGALAGGRKKRQQVGKEGSKGVRE